MAHWPSLSISTADGLVQKIRPIWRALPPGVSLLHTDSTDSITATVNLDSVPQSSVPVFLYYRNTGRLIERKLTDTNGLVVFSNLDATDSNAYFVVAEVNGTLNMLVYDRV